MVIFHCCDNDNNYDEEGIIAGGTAGVVVETALYPIDTIKTRLQAAIVASCVMIWDFQAAHGGGMIHWKGLYAGLAGNLAGVLPASAIFVGVYEPTKQKLLKTFPEHLSAFAHLIAGTVGGAAASFVRVPTEVIKQRLQTGQFSDAPAAVRLIVAKEGFKGLYADQDPHPHSYQEGTSHFLQLTISSWTNAPLLNLPQ
ncbi:S-adenosylmethionine carrier 1, chloroplastic/mitochondrial [Asimina triloba]